MMTQIENIDKKIAQLEQELDLEENEAKQEKLLDQIDKLLEEKRILRQVFVASQ
jgi:hypothetical protein